MKYAVLIVVSAATLLAVSDEPRPNPYLLTVNSRMAETDAQIEEFRCQLDWLVDRLQGYSDEEIEKYEVARNRQQELEKLRSQFQKAQDAFLVFRHELTQCHACMPGTTDMNELVLYSKARMDATNWFVDYIREAFFPHEWEKQYEAFKQAKASHP